MSIQKKREKLVWIGNGMAGMRSVEEVVKLVPGAFDVTIVGEELARSYNRILLSSVLQGEAELETIYTQAEDWFLENKISLKTGVLAEKIDTNKKLIQTNTGEQIEYDKLIIATGSKPFILPIPGIELQGVTAFRTIQDCEKLMKTAANFSKAVVIGGGLLGLEAAKGLMQLGMEVHVVHRASYLMERQLDETASLLLQNDLQSQGMNIHLNKETTAFTGDKRVKRVNFSDGTSLEADLVVMSAGVRPNIELAAISGIQTNRGINVDDRLRTSVKDIYAVGECVEHRGLIYGMVKPLYEQGKVLAQEICGIEGPMFRGSLLTTKLKVTGVKLFAVGDIFNSKDHKSLSVMDEVRGIYRKMVFHEDRLVGTILYGETSDHTKLLELVEKQTELSNEEKQKLLFVSGNQNEAIAEMLGSQTVCQCNGVSKSEIMQAIHKHSLETVDEIKTCTKASSSCGGCKPVVADLLTFAQGDEWDLEVDGVVPLCSCTKLSEDEVVQAIHEQELRNLSDIFSSLSWMVADGCSVCQDTLSYYLGMMSPDYHIQKHQQINATKQANGLYAVFVTLNNTQSQADQMSKVANVLFHKPHINVHSSRSLGIFLAGIREQELKDVWQTFDLPHTTLKGSKLLVHTQVDMSRCTCIQDQALEASTELSQLFTLIQMPADTVVSIQTCSHYQVEVDIQVIKSVVGWEVYLGDKQEDQLFYVVPSSNEIMIILPALLQYYRQTAKYKESLLDWIDRISMVHVREIIFDTNFSFDLIQDLKLSQEKTYKLLKAHLNELV